MKNVDLSRDVIYNARILTTICKGSLHLSPIQPMRVRHSMFNRRRMTLAVSIVLLLFATLNMPFAEGLSHRVRSLAGNIAQTRTQTLLGSNVLFDAGSSASDTGADNVISPSLAAASFGVVKAMLGSGLLALPSGLAAVTNYPAGLLPALVLIAVLGVISAYTFSIYGRLTHATQGRSLGDVWKLVHEQSSPTENSQKVGLIVSLATFVFCFGSCVAFSLTIGDMSSSFLQGSQLALPSWAVTRQASILAITSLMVFPLCNLSSLTALAPVSIFGVLGALITTAFLALRCPAVVQSSPYKAAGIGMLEHVTRQPSFSTYSRLRSPAPLVLMAMSCVSYLAHFSAPDFYHTLAAKQVECDPSEKTAIRRFTKVTVVAYASVAILNALALSFGFLTFGGSSSGIILNNYNNADIGANFSRLLMCVSVIGSYPFVMGACRSAALELFESGKPVTRAIETRMTTTLLLVATVISLVVKDAGFIVSFNGAIMGSTIAFTFPALLFLKLKASRISSGAENITNLLRTEQWLCRALVGFGVVSALAGGATTVATHFFPQLLS